ncbi:MAG: alpha/beta fold hydrolase [Deltaproteobacteria bacterium]|nr:alpha/beta fold hydrolase [Deltaproteobacteria bacterium]
MKPDDAIISHILFHPREEEPGFVPEGIRTLTVSGNAEIGGYLHLHPTSDTLLLFFHGNGEIAADYDDISSFFTNCGVSFWIVDYRGYGRSSGLPSYSLMFDDAQALLNDVLRMAQAVGRTFNRILVMGRSLGSASAMFLASRHASQLSGLLLDSPYADGLKLIYRLSGIALNREDLPEFMDNIDLMRTTDLPTLIIHGTIDQIIPVSDARALYNACGNTARRLVEIEGAGHNDLMFRGGDQYWSSIRQHIMQTIQKPIWPE